MKLESITVENYRQFEKAELTFDEGITILAGASKEAMELHCAEICIGHLIRECLLLVMTLK